MKTEEKIYSESETLKMLEALRQRCAEEAKLRVTNRLSNDTITGNMDFALHYIDGKITRVDKDSILSIDLTQFLPPLNK